MINDQWLSNKITTTKNHQKIFTTILLCIPKCQAKNDC